MFIFFFTTKQFIFFFFFFSSRRRHTRFSRDWSSDVCSSDLVLLQGPYGEEFLSFTEQPGTIWGTSSLSESIRLLGFWVMYVGVGFGVTEPFLRAGPTYLFDEGVIVGTFLVPLLAFGGLLVTRRWRYAPFLVLMGVGALLVMYAGFPNGTPFRRFLLFAYERAEPLQFLRTT